MKTPHVVAGTLRIDSQRHVECELYLWPTEKSYTRQPTAELHTIGSQPILQRMLEQLCRTGARLAQPGEFTLRAFLAGRLDLTQAEAVLGVIDANNDSTLRVALNQLAGGLSAPLNQLRDELLNLCADIEAGLDFVEDDIEFVTSDDVIRRLSAAARFVLQTLEQMGTRGTTDKLPSVVLVGPPNAGKSSLLNCIVGSAAAIVSPIAGTTRDYVSCVVDLDGLRCELIDTAGVETQSSGPAAAAQAMTESARQQSQLRLLCVDASSPDEATTANLIQSRTDDDLLIATKSDIAVPSDFPFDVTTSSKTGLGISRLIDTIRDRLTQDDRMSGQLVSSTTIRCRTSLRDCLESLERAQLLATAKSGDELVAAEIRTSLDQLGQVVGAIYTDDVLDRVFSRFCIGK
jgi:tRNA modification GTPase